MKSLNWLTAAVLCLNVAFAQTGEQPQYRIQPGDQLSIYVHENQDLTMVAPVLPDGTISYPLVGNLYVEGLTTAGLQDILTEKLRSFLQSPVVVVSISSQASYKVYIMGEVRTPGALTYQEDLRLTDYIALAGGTGPEANLKKCYIFSKGSDTPHRTINLMEIIEDDKQELNITLNPDDTIVIGRRSGFIITQWVEIAQIFSIMVASATLYVIFNKY